MEKLLPQNIEAEAGVLGSIIVDPEAINAISDFLYPEDFYRDVHRTIYEAMLALYEQHIPADFLTLCDALERHGKLEACGGASYITRLIDQVPTSGNAEFYGRIVERTSILRHLIHTAGQIAAIAYEEGDADVALSKAESLLFELRRGKRASFLRADTILSAYLEKLEVLHDHRGSIIGIPTGYRSLDRLTGGLQKTDLIVLAARPGMGKSSAALNFAYNAMREHDKYVAIFSMEMGKEQLIQKLLAMDTGMDTQVFRNGRFEQDGWDKIVTSMDRLPLDHLWIDDTAALSITELRSRALRLKAEQDVDLIIVDYVQLMHATHNGKHIENRVQELSEITAGLKALAKELDVPVLALAQVSRAVEARQVKVPQLSDLRESGTFEQDSDIVMFLYRDDYYAGVNQDTGESLSDRSNETDVIIAKHRNGPTGEISLYWSAEQTRFFNNKQERDFTYGIVEGTIERER